MEVTDGFSRTLLHSGFILPVLLGNWSLRLPGGEWLSFQYAISRVCVYMCSRYVCIYVA